MKRLSQPIIIDGESHIYRLPRGECLGVFDGDVMLEETCYEIDRDEHKLALRSPPVGPVQVLVSV